MSIRGWRDAVMGRPEMSCPWTLLTERDVPKTCIPLKTVSLMLIILVYTCPCVILSQLYHIPQQFYPNVICAEGPKRSGLSVTTLECKDDIILLIISSRIFYVFYKYPLNLRPHYRMLKQFLKIQRPVCYSQMNRLNLLWHLILKFFS